MAHRIVITQPGGPEAMQLEEVDVGAPGPGMVRLRQTAIGLNFIDVYHRTGLYPQPLPTGLGLEAAGVVEAVGDGVEALAIGDRVAGCWGPIGAYATHRIAPADKLVRLPEGVADAVAAAAMLKGCTVEYLVQRTFRVEPGMTVLWHAAAGGVGLIAGQWLAAMGVTAIGTVGSAAKVALAKAHGYAHVIDASTDDVVARVKEFTGGRGCPVVYDSVGASTWDISVACTAPRGLIASFGNASGPVPPVNLGQLAAGGGLFVTRPSLFHYYGTRPELEQGCADLFARIADGRITIRIDQRYALADIAQAHRDLEARRTTGSTVILP
jgi:NADPH2:quinone reductase